MRVIQLRSISVADFQRRAEQIITNARMESELLAGFEDFGITDDVLSVGQDLFDAFSESALRFQELRGEEESAIQKRDTFIDDFQDGLLGRHIARANVAFSGDSGVQTKLRMSDLQIDNVSRGDWLSATKNFYTILLEDDALFARLAETHVSRDEVEAGRDRIDEALQLDREHGALVGHRQQARRTRDEHRNALIQWLRDLQEKARNIFQDRPDLLELLGFVVPSES